MGNLNNFGRIIADERKKKGMTQDELAAVLNITPQAVSKWENGIGLPDVTLFPKIAQALEIQIGELFGAEGGNEACCMSEYPAKFEGLPFICSENGVACFSDKAVERVEKSGGLVVFLDGSTADLVKRTAVNTGAGEIRFIKYEDCGRRDFKRSGGGATSYERSFDAFSSLSVSMSLGCNVNIHRGGPVGRVFATGTEYFISLIEAKCDGGFLEITVKHHNDSGNNQKDNKMDIYTGFECGRDLSIKINGSSDFIVEPDFDSMSLGINGSGNIKAGNSRKFGASINGSGDIEVGNAGDAAIKINGSGDVSCVSANIADMKINGSGDINIGKPEGDITIKIAGSGDFKCGEGRIDKLIVSVSGSGDIKADKLTVRESNIEVRGGANITIGRIVERSVEKIPKGSRLKVLQRG